MGKILKIILHLFLFLVAFAAFFFGLGIGLAWPGVTFLGLTLSGPTAGSLLWLIAGAIGLGNLIWMVVSLSRAGRSSAR